MAAVFPQYSTTGFYKTPVSKALLGSVFITSCALNVPLLAYKPYFIYTYKHIFEQLQLWRLFSSKLAFFEAKDLVCGSLLLYYFRIFERRYGSQKFASCVLAVCTISTLLELVTVFILHHLEVEINDLPVGPYGLIFSLFVPYFFDVPRVAHTSVLGVPVTGKTLTYLLGLQMLQASKESAICAICGIIAGVLYRFNIFKVQSIFWIPNVVVHIFDTTLGWLLSSSPPQENSLPLGATLEIQRQQHLEQLEQQLMMNRVRDFRIRGMQIGREQGRQQMGQGYAEQLIPPAAQLFANHNVIPAAGNIQPDLNLLHQRHVVEADMNNIPSTSRGPSRPTVAEDQVQRLVEMGFNRESVLEALRATNNDINLATNVLLQES